MGSARKLAAAHFAKRGAYFITILRHCPLTSFCSQHWDCSPRRYVIPLLCSALYDECHVLCAELAYHFILPLFRPRLLAESNVLCFDCLVVARLFAALTLHRSPSQFRLWSHWWYAVYCAGETSQFILHNCIPDLTTSELFYSGHLGTQSV